MLFKKRSLALLGTGSDVGKSIVVTALCRIFKNRGIKVAPYKAQNMSNNSYVTLDGGEMGRAQVVQAEACGIEPHTDMNPVLLKPNTDIGSQVILHGKAIGSASAAEYFRDTKVIFSKANESLNRLLLNYDFVVIEGAGSCAEVNLRSRDFVNFETAHAADAPVILVADIDKGGVFAQIIGSMDVIPQKDRERVAGFIINKFRGDPELFQDGISYIERRTGLPVLGLIPFYRNIEIDSEDGMPLETVVDPPSRPLPGKINIAAVRFPHISNFTDFNPLIRNEHINFHYLSRPRCLDGYDLLMLPGSKNVRFDLQWLKDTGWADKVSEFRKSNGMIFGVCGGYQMLGRKIYDPAGVEGAPGESDGLGFLDVETTLKNNKILSRSQGMLLGNNICADGYEIHMGESVLGRDAKPFLKVNVRNMMPVDDYDGAVSRDGLVRGSYFHGLFDFYEFRNWFLKDIHSGYPAEDVQAAGAYKEAQYDLLADHFEKHLDIDKIIELLS
jgi:adenosylcobyric acid synthase